MPRSHMFAGNPQPPHAWHGVLSHPIRHCATVQVALSREAALQGKVDHRVKEMEGEVAVLRRLSHPNIVRYYVSPC